MFTFDQNSTSFDTKLATINTQRQLCNTVVNIQSNCREISKGYKTIEIKLCPLYFQIDSLLFYTLNNLNDT